jgi:hypothetical protein
LDVQPEHSDSELKPGLPEGLGLSEALPLLFSAARTGRLSTHASDGPPLEVWVEEGRVVHAEWGRLRDLSALEMAALLPPDSDVRFNDGERTSSRSLDLSAIDVTSRLAEVSRAGGSLARAIPGIEASPRQTGFRPRLIDPDSARVLEQVDGTRTVTDLVSGRQPLAVVRALANLTEQGAVTFQAVENAPPPAPLKVVPPPAELPEPSPSEEVVAAEFADRTAPPSRRFPVNFGLAALALLIAIGLWLAIQRTQTGGLTVSGEAPTAAPATQVAVAAGVPTSAPTVVPTPPPTAAPTAAPAIAPTAPPTSAPTAPPAAAPTLPPTAAPTSPPTLAPTSAPTAAPAVAPTSPPTPPTAPPTSAPTAAPTTPPAAAPTAPPTGAPTLASTAAAAPTSPPTAAAPATPAAGPTQPPLLDETFASGDDGWPNAATSSAFWDTAGYHLVPRNAGQFVAITAPASPIFTNGSVTALFRKLAGPVGGGYGLILRAQAPLDGSSQGGRYYVFEVGDRGEVGAWRREQNQWIDLQPWLASEAVHAGAAENRLQVQAAGPQFTFSVNDTPVAQVTDSNLTSGAVGVFTGGDGNQVVLERFTVQ